MIKCGECGVPRVFSYTTHWTDDGVILSMPRGLIRLLFMEREHMVAVFRAIEEKLGLPIDHIITEAKRKDAWTYVQDVLPPVVHEWVRKPFLRRLAYLAMIKQAATIGLGKAKLLEYREGRLLVGKISPVYYHALFAGDALGAFETFEGRRAELSYAFLSSEMFLRIEASENAHVSERLELKETPIVKAQADFQRCSRCVAPSELAHFRWDAASGKIVDERTGEWFFVQGTRALDAVLRELEFELGEEIPHLVAEATWSFFRRLKEKNPDAFEDLSFLKIRGMGVPDKLQPSEEDLRDGLDVRNGYHGAILAGMVAAVYEGEKPSWEWESPSPGVIRVRLS